MEASRPRAGRRPALLAIAPWCVAATGFASSFLLPGPADGPAVRTALLLTIAGFFALLLTRIVVAAARHRRQRPAMALLFSGVVLWAAGSATLSANQAQEAVPFPSPGEVLYLLSYLGLFAFLLVDVPRRRLPVTTVWLEAAVLSTAGACLTAFAVLTPLSSSLEGDGVALLVALLYPLIDCLLVVLVVAQVLLGLRGRTWRTAGLVVAFTLLAVADSSLVTHGAAHGEYSASVYLESLWGAAFGVLVAAAVAPQREERVQPRPQNGYLLLVAASVAIVVLVLRPAGPLEPYVTVPAMLALVCTGARLVLALREAQGAAEALRLSRTDELTGLPNRRALLATAEERLGGRAATGLLLLDLDGFKDVNDSLGHQVGDHLLVLMAQRMRSAVADDVLVTRLGGDEFALLVTGADDLTLFETAADVRRALRTPVRTDGLDLSIDASVGIAVARPGDSATELLRRADIAMYQAKSSGAGTLAFDPAHDGLSRERLQRGEELRHALELDQLVLWYQPQVDARTGAVVGLEALVRWAHPTEGLLGPMEFLPDARRAGLMPHLTVAVTRMALRQAREWAAAGAAFRVSVNWAPPELLGGLALDALVRDLADVRPDETCSLMVEVTEDSFVAEPQRAREVLQRLRGLGVETSIDDYGTGFSSLAYLRDLPVQELKIDRSFVSTVAADERSAMIVRTTTQMAHGLGLRLVAEGVEDDDTAALLRALGVDVLQGYAVCRPVPADEVLGWVAGWRRAHAATSRPAPPRPATPGDGSGRREQLSL